MDELFELLTLVQTRKTKKYMPIIVYGKDYWNQILSFDALVEAGTISEEDLDIFRFFDDVDSAFEYLKGELTKHYVRGNAHQEMPL
jgi:predicted Rossmann-fold nucleotide-binding protein